MGKRLLDLDSGVEPLEIVYQGKAYAVPHPADLDSSALDALAALGDMKGLQGGEVADETVAALNEVVAAIAPALQGASFMRKVRFLSWYAEIMGEYMGEAAAPKEQPRVSRPRPKPSRR